MPFSPLADILEDLRRGKMVILTDDEDRENEGDLILPAEFVTAEAVNFMLSVARGYLCLSLTERDCDRLDLHPQALVNTSARATPFTVSIDGHPKHGFTTGVSAKERARTIRMAIDPGTTSADFVRPGHINPLRSRNGGVLVRTGQTEGSVDLCRLAGLYPAACIIEVMREDGEMARLPDLQTLAAKHGIKICSVAQIIQHRLTRESLVERLTPAEGTVLRTALGEFKLFAFQSVVDPLPHVALCAGGVGDLDPQGQVIGTDEPTLVRMHRRHLLGDVFLDLDSAEEGPTGRVLHAAMRMIQEEGRGAVVYLRPQGSGTPVAGSPNVESRLQWFRSQPGTLGEGSDAAPVETPGGVTGVMRDVGVGGQILRLLGLRKLRLITNHPKSLPAIEGFGLEVLECIGVGRE